MKPSRLLLALSSFALPSLAGCGAPPAPTESTASASAAVTSTSIASLALANVGKGACSTNSQGGAYFDSSCTGNGGQPEYWCADFARWVWEAAGASNTSELTAAAGSFYVYGQNHGTLHNTPVVGDAVVFDYQGGGVADHVALVTQVNSDGTIESVSGDWDGQSGSEATFASTSHAVLNSPAYADGVGGSPAVMGMTISGYISPVGLTGAADYGAAFVSQSFPLASSALKIEAGATVAASITLKNTGGNTWDSSTHLGTTQPRDRDCAFADSSWLKANRPAGVTGTVAPGATYTFKFSFHAPDKPGTYFEYFNLVQEGVAWFSDPGQGGPVDDDLEAQIEVTPAPDAGTAPTADAGAPHEESDAGVGSGSGASSGSSSGGGVVESEDAGAGTAPTPVVGPTGDPTAPGSPVGPTSDGAHAAAGGCALSRGPLGGSSGAGWVALGLVASIARRRRRR